MIKILLWIVVFVMLAPGRAMAQEVDTEAQDVMPVVAPVYDSISSMAQDEKSLYNYHGLAESFLRGDLWREK